MSPKVINDSFSHIPDPMKRLRLRWARDGRCTRCGGKDKEDGYTYCRGCNGYFRDRREWEKHKKEAA